MENWKIVGFREVNFTDNDGITVNGWKLYLAREPENRKIFGLETDTLFISKAHVDFTPEENIMVSINFNRHGKVSSIVPLEACDAR